MFRSFEMILWLLPLQVIILLPNFFIYAQAGVIMETNPSQLQFVNVAVRTWVHLLVRIGTDIFFLLQVALHLLSEKEKADLAQLVNTMVSYATTYKNIKSDPSRFMHHGASDVSMLSLDPPIGEFINFKVSMVNCTHRRKLDLSSLYIPTLYQTEMNLRFHLFSLIWYFLDRVMIPVILFWHRL